MTRNGHAVGDQLICTFAAVVSERLRKSDFAARIGGDEFAVLLPDTGVEGAEILAARLRDAYARVEVQVPGGILRVGVSIGCATHDGMESAESLFGRADHRMYVAKDERDPSP